MLEDMAISEDLRAGFRKAQGTARDEV